MSEDFPQPSQQQYDPSLPLQHPSEMTPDQHSEAYRLHIQDINNAAATEVVPTAAPESAKEYFNFSWQVPGVSEEVQDYVYEQYTNLVEAELQPALPEDVIRIPRPVAVDSVEATMMRAVGFDDQKIESSEFTREDLLKAGFFFINRLGGGEKGIIHTTIPDPESPDGVLDLTNRTLLTKAELDKVYAHQIKTEGGLQGIPVDQVRADALTFLLAAQQPAVFRGKVEMAKECIPLLVEDEAWQTGTPEERAAVIEFIADFQASYEESQQVSAEQALRYVRMDGQITGLICSKTKLSDEKLYYESGMTAGGVSTTTRTGTKAYSINERSEKLRDAPSPFLESGFRFQANPDILVETSANDPQPKRMNMVNIHLMGGHPDYPGLSEMGQADWDQGYLTTGDFLQNFAAIITNMGEEEAWRQDLQMIDREKTRQQVIKQAQINLIEYAKSLSK